MKSITLTQGYSAIVDDGDYEWLNQWKWSYGSGYAVRNLSRLFGGNHIKMHRAIMNAPDDKEVDHINSNPLDNRRENLRLCTSSENMRNRRMQKNNTTGFKGVSVSYKSYQAKIRVSGKLLHVGVFKTPEEAARAYDAAAIKHFGEFAKLNFP